MVQVNIKILNMYKNRYIMTHVYYEKDKNRQPVKSYMKFGFFVPQIPFAHLHTLEATLRNKVKPFFV